MERDVGQEMLAELHEIRELLAHKPSLWKQFFVGMVYGIGFVIGSSVLAVLIISISLPFLSKIPFVQRAFNHSSQSQLLGI
jgi:hypothetical protein